MKRKFMSLSVITLLFVVGLCAIYFLICYVVKDQISKLDTFEFLDSSYTKVEDGQLGCFIPFGEGGFESFDNKIKFKKFLGLSYYKGDKEKNFIYNMTILDTDVFMKDGYMPPEKPTPDTVDILLVYSGLEDEKVKITNKQDIIDIVSYFNEVRDIVRTDFFDSTGTLLSIHAISHDDGGVHYITGSAFKDSNNEIRLYTLDGGSVSLPENIQNIINSYLV